MRVVRCQSHFADVADRVKRRPATARIKLVVGREELFVADDASVPAIIVQSKVLARERPAGRVGGEEKVSERKQIKQSKYSPFGSLLLGHMVLDR